MCRHGFAAALGLATAKLVEANNNDTQSTLSHLLFLVKDNTAGMKKVGEGIDGLLARAVALAAIVEGGVVTTMEGAEEVAAMAWELFDASKKQSMIRLLAARVIVLLTNKGKFQLKSVTSRTTTASSGDINPAVVQVPALAYVYFSTRPDSFRLSKVETIKSIVSTLSKTTTDFPSPSYHPAWEPLLEHTDGAIAGQAICTSFIGGNLGEKALMLRLFFGLGKFFGPWPKEAVELLLNSQQKDLRKTQEACLERMAYYFGTNGSLVGKLDDDARNDLLMSGIKRCIPGMPGVVTTRILSICVRPLGQQGVSSLVSNMIPLASTNRWAQERLCNAVSHPSATEDAIKSALEELLKEGPAAALALRKALTTLSHRPTGDWASVAFQCVRDASSLTEDNDKLAKRVLKTIKKSDHKEAIGPWLKWQWINVAAPGGDDGDEQEALDNLDGAIGAADEFDALVGALPDLYGESKNIVRYSTGRLWQYLVKEGYVSWADADEMVKDVCGESEEEEVGGEGDDDDDLDDENDDKPFLPPIIPANNGDTDDIVMEDEDDLLAMLNDEDAERAAQAFIQQQGKSAGAKHERGKEAKVVIMRKIHRVDLLEIWVTTTTTGSVAERLDVVTRILAYAGRMRINKKSKESGGDGGLNEAKMELRNRLIGMVRRFRTAKQPLEEAPSEEVITKLVYFLPDKEAPIQQECAHLIAYLSRSDPHATAKVLTKLMKEWCSGGKYSIHTSAWESLSWPLLAKVEWNTVVASTNDVPAKGYVLRELLAVLHRLAKSKQLECCPQLDEVVYRVVGAVADKWSNGTLGRSRGQIAIRAIQALIAVGGQQRWDAAVIQWLEDLKKQTALGTVSKLAATALAARVDAENKKKRSREEEDEKMKVVLNKKAKVANSAATTTTSSSS
ncbi:hypothetical protein Pmar_PMAR024024 [Perkinsus marinus ATCC 50983]|uniref:Uncharacterized protein n=1 Tax=Perkinsus marinus (strain ATCC 50983 / TXsc) TaxID=423536 RepID=C5L6F9_PERM5|nr:hypothetical protein Pmar_PMAR024024 [Perkinsus marinus ATCC 50983]EER07620.1 hypothetical protein Pmar_PMAR024024 [Perkinsus marinus ATCC 50983]|eukprot:XP_002775804.1 hypothetical protein Pmar_PMAR024024 [Perkinsus marinus ATCC 50983]